MSEIYIVTGSIGYEGFANIKGFITEEAALRYIEVLEKYNSKKPRYDLGNLMKEWEDNHPDPIGKSIYDDYSIDVLEVDKRD